MLGAGRGTGSWEGLGDWVLVVGCGVLGDAPSSEFRARSSGTSVRTRSKFAGLQHPFSKIL